MGYQSYTHDLVETGYAAAQEVRRKNRRMEAIKRATDFCLAAIGIVFLLPVLVPIAIAIRLSDGGPALFAQRRIGRNGQEFMCLKFRTMVTDSKERLEDLLANDPQARKEWLATQKLENDPRITGLGSFLRKSSLDELPQLFNILTGKMSIVGPRPIVSNEISKYGEHFRDYCRVRPGLTGLWQVSGRSGTTYDQRVALDVEYVSDWSFTKDLEIIIKTVPAVLRSDGAH